MGGREGHRLQRGRGEAAHVARGSLGQGGAGKDLREVPPLRPGELLIEPEHFRRGLLGDEEQARGVLGTLEVASHPVEAVGDAGEDHGSRAASTQVSLLPPPWEEFTTYDPARRATRVSPPGRTRIRSP